MGASEGCEWKSSKLADGIPAPPKCSGRTIGSDGVVDHERNCNNPLDPVVKLVCSRNQLNKIHFSGKKELLLAEKSNQLRNAAGAGSSSWEWLQSKGASRE
jgi:hypothetical protein